jgi:segregation and condensation protein A
VEEFFEEIDDGFFYENEDDMIVPELVLTGAYSRDPMRAVTMYELIDAFEEAREEIEIQQLRERVREELKSKQPSKFDNKAHEEDDRRDVEEVWQRIQRLGLGQICITDLYTHDLKENLKIFVSILHLVRDGRLNVWQDTLPYGEIFVEIVTEGASVTIEDNPAGRIQVM